MSDESIQTNLEAQTPKTDAPSKRQMSFTLGDDGVIRAEFGEGVEPLALNVAEIPEAIYALAVGEGVISRLRGYTSKLTESERNPTNLRAAIATGMTNILAGTWKIARVSASGETEFPIEVEAAYQFRVKRVEKAKAKAAAEGVAYTGGEIGTLEQAAEAFALLTDDQKKQLKALPLYQLAYAEVKQARNAAKLEALAKKANAAEEASPF